MQANERTQHSLIGSNHAAGLHKRALRSGGLLALLGCMAALAGCAGSHENERPAATYATEPGAEASIDTQGNPPAERVDATSTEARREAAADMRAAEARAATSGDEAAPAGTGTMAREADNTDRNERDRNDATLTPMDQSNSSADIELTANIRQAVVGDDTLSFNAKNVKIISAGGKVTLRGAVNSAAEKARIEAHAHKVAGAGRVTSQLEIAK